MSESRDEATGQYTSAEPLYGQAGLEHDAGFEPYKEEEDGNPDELTIREATAQRIEDSTPESEIRTYTGVSELDDNATLTIEQAAKIAADSREADAAQAEIDETAKLQKEVDELRGAEPAKADKPEVEAQPVRDGELDPELEQARNNPKVRDAIQQQIGESEQARQAYLQNLDAATKIAQTSFVSQFPEFQGVPAEQHGAVLAAIQQQSPERFAQIHSAVERTAGLFAQQSAEQQRQAERERSAFQSYASTQDSVFAEMMKSETPAQMRAIEAEIPAMLKSVGVDPLEFLKAGSESRFLRSAAAQALLVKAAKYDLMQKAPKAIPARSVPQVVRPGISARRAVSDDVSTFDNRLSATGNIKDATAMLIAKRASRARSGLYRGSTAGSAIAFRQRVILAGTCEQICRARLGGSHLSSEKASQPRLAFDKPGSQAA
jgi:hypothetical protein